MGIPCERALSVAEVSALAQEPLVEIGLHTRTHADLGRGRDRETLYQEINVAKDELESMTGTKVRSFAYPFGALENCSPEAAEVLEGCGLDQAYTIIPGFNHSRSAPFSLHRDSLDPSMNGTMFSAWLDGSYDVLKAWSDRRKGVAAAPKHVDGSG